LSGRYLVARFNRCQDEDSAYNWGLYDPEWHVWAYAMSIDGATPYLFAFNRYLPVWFRSDVYRDKLAAPGDWLVLSRWIRETGCATNNVSRLLWTIGADGYDGVLVVGLPEAERRRLAEVRELRLEPLTPELLVVRRASTLASSAPPNEENP